MFTAVDADAYKPEGKEDGEDTRSTKATTLESQISVFNRENCGTDTHEKAGC